MSTSLVSNASYMNLPYVRRRFQHSEWVITLLLLGYPLFGTLVAFTSLSSLVASVPVRVLILLLSLSMILRTPRSVWTNVGACAIFLFWIIYLIRLMWDGWIVGIPVAGEFTLSFVGFCIPTAIAFMQAPIIDERRLSMQLLVLGVITCLLAIVAYYSGLAGERSSTELAGGRLFLETVNPITYGHVGVTTLLAALSMTRYCTRVIGWIGLVVAVVLSCIVLQLAGSRGPLLALVVCVFAVGLISRHYRWLLLLSFIGLLILSGSLIFSDLSTASQNVLVSRINSSVSDNSLNIRVLMIKGALYQFLDSPLIGSAIIEKQFEDYPHNVFLEVAMAVGAIGLLLFIFIILRATKRIFHALGQGEILLSLLALQALVAAQVSGTVSASASMWMFLALFSGTALRRRQRMTDTRLSLPVR